MPQADAWGILSISHSYNYNVDGEELPEKNSKINKKALLVSISVALIDNTINNLI